MTGVVIGAMMALGMVQQTDTTFAVGEATRLEVDSPGGTIVVNVWDRQEIRIQAEHSTRTYVDIDRRGRTIDVEAEANRGPANIVDFVITVPRAFDLELDGMYTDITVEGSDGEVEAESLQGDVIIRGGRGVVKASSIQGRVLVEGSQGRVEAESAAAEIRIRNASGEILAESAGGDIILENIRATSVDVGNVGGRIYYSGSFAASGTYFFGSHGGSITLSLPESTAASMTLSTIHGSITSNLAGAPTRFERGQRNAFDVGGGGAIVEVETFGGRIRVVRQGTEGAAPPAPREGRAGAHPLASPHPVGSPTSHGGLGLSAAVVDAEALSAAISHRVGASLAGLAGTWEAALAGPLSQRVDVEVATAVSDEALHAGFRPSTARPIRVR